MPFPFPVALALLFALALPVNPASAQVGLERGVVPAAVVVEDLDGDAVDLGRWIGRRPVLVEFWATWCPQCEELAPEMTRAHARFRDRVDFLIVAVGINQKPRNIRRHMKSHPMPGTVLYDARGRATRAFRAPTTSYVAILDAKGRVVYTGTGADQELTAVLERLFGS